MSAVSRRPTRPQPVPWHRMIFGLLLVLAVVTPIAIWILIVKGHTTDTANLRFLFRVWAIFTVFLLIWSAIYIKREPNLVRIVIAVVAFVFGLFATKATFNPATQPSANRPAPAPSEPKNVTASATPAPAANPEKKKGPAEYLLGKWQMAGHAQTVEFQTENRFTITGDDGKAQPMTYTVIDATHFDTLLPHAPASMAMHWTFAPVNENEMTLKFSEKSKPATYTRVRLGDENVLFQDDFKTGAAWKLPAPPAAAIANGRLTLQADAGKAINVIHPAQTFGDVSVSVNVEIPGEDPEAAAGICFWGDSGFNNYNALISGIQSMTIYHWTGSKRVYLSDWKLYPQLKKGLKQTNLLKVVTRGNNVTVNLNGVDVIAVTSQEPAGNGLVGLRLGSPPESKTLPPFPISG